MSSIALEDIWDAPVDEASRRASSPIDLSIDASPRRASKRPRSTLFLDSDSEGEGAALRSRQSIPPQAERSEIDAMFDNLEAEPDSVDGDLPPALDLDALRRKEDAKNAQIYKKPKLSALDLDVADADGDAGGEGQSKRGGKDKQKRKPLPKLDEARLLGQDGFPALLKQAKTFKPKGKGHEATDLNRLLQVYQYWTHKMYPKTQFRDTVKRVEKLCHSKRMHVALTVWRDEFKGVNTGRKLDADSDESSDDEEGGDRKPITNDNGDGVDVPDVPGTELSRPPSHPPSSEPPSSDGIDDFDIDAMIREEEERQAAESRSAGVYFNRNDVAQSTPVVQDEDEAMWDALDEPVHSNPGTASAQPASMASNPPPDEDEDMWDVIREMEAAESSKVGAPITSGFVEEKADGDGPANNATNHEGWDEMYV